jgi:hypothetical protein
MKAIYWWEKAAAQGGEVGKEAQANIDIAKHGSSQ